MTQPGLRNYNLDLLRIVAMLMILVLHFLGKGHILGLYPQGSLKNDATEAVDIVSLVAVNCYVLLSGYFLIYSSFKFKKLLSLSVQILFYSAGIYFLFLSLGVISYQPSEAVKSFFPVLTGTYWFVTAYFVMYVLSPFLNKFLIRLDKKTYTQLILVVLLIFSAWPTFFTFADTGAYGALNISDGYSPIWFIILYLIAGYLRIHYTPTHQTFKYIRRYIVITIVVLVAFFALNQLNALGHGSYLTSLITKFKGYNSIPVLLMSLAFFMIFLNIKIANKPTNKIISLLAPLTFAIYLIHEEPHVRAILWSTLAPSAHAYNHRFILYAGGVIFTIYFVCSVIEWLRQKLFTYITNTKLLNSLISSFSKQAKKVTQVVTVASSVIIKL